MKYLAILLLSVSLSYAGPEVTVDLSKLSSEARDAVLKTVNNQPKSSFDSLVGKAVTDPTVVVGWAKDIGLAVAEVCKALNVQVNEFSKTRVGVLITGLIIWKVAGKDIMSIVGSCVIMLIFLPIWLWSYRHFHMRERIVTKVEVRGKKEVPIEVGYISRYEFRSSDARVASACVHVGLLLGLMLIVGVIGC
jgi:hypothetical protein